MVNNYAEINIQNNSNGSNASADLIATSNTGNANAGYVDVGINSSTYTGNVVGQANDAYLYSTSSNLYVGNISTNKNLYLFAGGTTTTASMMLSSSGNFGIGTTSPVNRLDVYGNISCSVITASLLSGTASVSITSSYAITASQGMKAWGVITCVSSSNFTSSTYACSTNRIGLGSWGVSFSKASTSVPYAVCINAFSGSSNLPTASIAYSINQATTGFTMSFSTVVAPLIAADFSTASFHVTSY